jgi:hypothetical protein
VRKYYGNARELYNAVAFIPEDKRDVFEATSKRVKDETVIQFINDYLNGKSVIGLAINEIRNLIYLTRERMPASVRQLSSILMVSKEFVRRTIHRK